MKRAIFFSLSLFSFFAVKAQLRPGDVSPTAKVIDADKIGHFNKGAAIIQKGNLTALIDSAGNFIIPYGQYDLSYGFEPRIDNMDEDYQTGFFVATKTILGRSKTTYINSTGKIIYDESHLLKDGYKTKRSEDKYSYNLTSDNKYIQIASGYYDVDPTYYIDSDGKKYRVSHRFRNTLSEGIGAISSKDGMGFNYLTLENKFLPGTYSTAEPFSNGYAVVGKKDQFGNEKFGYINTKGEIAIPLQFSLKPESFSSGVAKVYPQKTDEFQYAFINKSGEIIYKHTRENQNKYVNIDFVKFFGNMCISLGDGRGDGKYILTVKGNIIPLEENIKGMKLNALNNKNILQITGFPYKKWIENHQNKILVYSKIEKVQQQEVRTYSFVNLDNGKAVDAPFAEVDFRPDYGVTSSLVFDPVSQLSPAKIYKSYSQSNRKKWEYTEGYINREGVFVIVLKKETSVW